MSAPPYFGRKFRLRITPQSTGEEWTLADSTWGSSSLRITFSIECVAMQAYWFADIAIYNILDSAQQVIQQGDAVILEAGYDNPGMSTIFAGRVFQPIWERPDEFDFRLTLHCFVGHVEDDLGFVSVPLGDSSAQLTQAQGVLAVAKAANIQCLAANLDPVLSQKTLPRGKPYAGRARVFFDQVASDNQLQCWIGYDGVHIMSLAPKGDTPDVIYAPPQSTPSQSSADAAKTKYTLVGSPSQTQLGANFRTLLDTELQIGQLVKLDQTIMSKIPLYPGQRPILLDKDGLFVVGGLRYVGDSRGNDWYSEVTGVTRDWAKLTGRIAR